MQIIIIHFKDIISHPDQLINNIYEDALNRDIENDKNPPRFCCCFHKHKTTCDFFKNLKNELYNNNEIKDIENLKETIPHFYHLYPDCFYNGSTCSEIVRDYKSKEESKGIEFPEINFCCHSFRCFKNYKNYLPKITKNKKITIYIPKRDEENKEELKNNEEIPGEKKKIKEETFTLVNICCCEKSNIHNINNVFINDFFSNKNKNNEIRFRNAEMTKEKEKYTPNYEKMISIIGNNKVIFKILQYFSSEKFFSLNIYGDNIENLKKFGDVIIEYYLERFYFFESNISSSNITRIKSSINFKSNLIEDNANKNEVNEIHYTKSDSLTKEKNIDFIKINLNDNYINNLKNEEKNNINKIYFVYVHDDGVNLIDKIKNRYNKIIWFSETKIDKNKKEINESIQFNKEPTIKTENFYKKNKNVTPNEYIKFQHTDIVRNYWRKSN